jgi:hypothetical protein
MASSQIMSICGIKSIVCGKRMFLDTNWWANQTFDPPARIRYFDSPWAKKSGQENLVEDFKAQGFDFNNEFEPSVKLFLLTIKVFVCNSIVIEIKHNFFCQMLCPDIFLPGEQCLLSVTLVLSEYQHLFAWRTKFVELNLGVNQHLPSSF